MHEKTHFEYNMLHESFRNSTFGQIILSSKTTTEKKQGFHAVCYTGTMQQFVQIETWFLE